VGNFLADAMAKRDILVKGDGLALRSYMHMADLTAWLLTLLVNGEPGKAYNVGSDESISIKGLAYMVARYSGSKVRVEGQMSGQSSYLPASFTGHHGLDLQTNIRLNEALERTWEWLNHS
jgi:dTDP-glucose 4,6-dehydratase